MNLLTPEQLLAEVEDVLRTMPERKTIHHELPDNYAWFGRAAAIVAEWNPIKSGEFDSCVRQIHSPTAINTSQSLGGILTLLHRARHHLRLKAIGPLTVAIDKGGVFDYFDEVRKLIEEAQSDLLFVDPYLDAEFVSRYLPHVRPGVAVRLLGKEKMSTLVPAVHAFAQQSSLTIQVRAAVALHDRFVFIDKNSCYQSGASFKDGAKKAPTSLAQVNDAFGPIQTTYETSWNSAQVYI
jgi:hypothetical protein